jgi:hypothetical protein
MAHRSRRKRRPDDNWIVMERQENYLFPTTGLAKLLSNLDAIQDGRTYSDNQDIQIQPGVNAESRLGILDSCDDFERGL